MLGTLSFKTTLFLLALFTHIVLAQQFPYSIQHITLLNVANLTSFDAIRNLGLTWDIVKANGVTLQFTFSTADSSIELMAGSVAGASNDVVDVLGLHITYTSDTFSLGTSLPSGDYHLRVNATVNTTVESTTIQSLTARGGGFHWTLPSDIGCGPDLTPAPFTPITSPGSLLFTSLLVVQPVAGRNIPLSSAGIFVSWRWRNRENGGGRGISGLSIQVVKNADGTAVGAPIVIDPHSLWLGSISLNASAIGMDVNQAYRLRIQYFNAVQDGQVSPGQIVTYTSEEFNIVAASVNCTARKLSPASTARDSPPASTTRDSPPTSTTRDSPPTSTTRDSPPTSTTRELPPASTINESPPASTVKGSPPASTVKGSPPASTTRDLPSASTTKESSPTSIVKESPPASTTKESPPACTARKSLPACPTSVSTATVNMMLQFENFEPVPKGDSSPGHFPTVGYGHKCTKTNCTEVPYPIPLNQTTALRLLASDLKVAVTCVNLGINNFVKLNDNQVGALGSFIFNIGCSAFRTSTLLRRMNAGENPNTIAAQEMPKWNRSRGQVLQGLVKRCAAEVALFQTRSSVLEHPCI